MAMADFRRLGLMVLAVLSMTVGARAAELTVVNASQVTIGQLYLAMSGQSEWGPDRLSDPQPHPLAPGEARTFTELAPGTYDVRVVDGEGTECEMEAIAIETAARLELTAARLAACTSSN